MNADKPKEFLHKELTEEIIRAAYVVHNTLGYGFAEKVYENALAIELRKHKLDVEQQASIKVFYNGELVGDYLADLLVNEKVIIELKAVKQLLAEHEAQLLNYLRATEVEVGLLLNFGRRVEIKRLAFSNRYKVGGGRTSEAVD